MEASEGAVKLIESIANKAPGSATPPALQLETTYSSPARHLHGGTTWRAEPGENSPRG